MGVQYAVLKIKTTFVADFMTDELGMLKMTTMTKQETMLALKKMVSDFATNKIGFEAFRAEALRLRLDYVERNKTVDNEFLSHLFSIMELEDDLQTNPLQAAQRLIDVYDYCGQQHQ